MTNQFLLGYCPMRPAFPECAQRCSHDFCYITKREHTLNLFPVCIVRAAQSPQASPLDFWVSCQISGQKWTVTWLEVQHLAGHCSFLQPAVNRFNLSCWLSCHCKVKKCMFMCNFGTLKGSETLFSHEALLTSWNICLDCLIGVAFIRVALGGCWHEQSAFCPLKFKGSRWSKLTNNCSQKKVFMGNFICTLLD